MKYYVAGISLVVLILLGGCTNTTAPSEQSWLAGDHHIHSRFSVGWDYEQDPPAPKLGDDAIYPLPMNAIMGRYHGLSWLVGTDHGGPNHSKVNLEWAYPAVQRSRLVVPEVVQFYGMELNTPGGDHSSLIVPHTHDEAQVLYQLESGYDKRDAHPYDQTRDTEAKMLEALAIMRDLPSRPVVIAHHPSRSAKGYGEYGSYTPAEFRNWNNTAPEVAVGMAGSPGHQASTLKVFMPEGKGARGGYSGYPTLGGFDQMTAKVGGFWDSMLGEGRRWWITANSDSHVHYSEGGSDFWPGEYSKTYVYAEKNHDSILAGIRAGHVFVTTGDLISELFVEVAQGRSSASIGDELRIDAGKEVTVNIRFKRPDAPNPSGTLPEVNRVDLILGEVRGKVADLTTNSNDTTRVIKRFTSADWQEKDGFLTVFHSLILDNPAYVRVRGTNTDELEPALDPHGENPWDDLWFYSNPVFIAVQ